VVFSNQVHGSSVRQVFASDVHPGDCDALVAAGGDAFTMALGVLVADCVPVLLADVDAEVVAVAHAGCQGLLSGVIQNVVAAMCSAGAETSRIKAVLGPAVDGCCYELPEAMVTSATGVLLTARTRTRSGAPALDLRSGCSSALLSVGVTSVQRVGPCTRESRHFFSYRAAGSMGAPTTGRFAGVIRLVAADPSGRR
jgi:YfiH family protein